MRLSNWTAADVAKTLSGSGKAQAKKSGNSWKVCCPAHDDRTPSLSLTDGDKMLLYNCFGGCSQEDVKKALEQKLGINNQAYNSEYKKPRKTLKKIVDSVETIIPVPENEIGVTLDSFYHFDYGSPTKVWTYRLPGGKIANWIARYDQKDGKKDIIPWSWTRDNKTGKERLWMKGIADNRPLYNLDKIIDNPDAPIIWCEGEKAADAASILFPTWITTATQGGTKSISKTDMKPLHGRTVIIMPDHDRAGSLAGSKMLSSIGNKCKMLQIIWPHFWPGGDDYDLQEQDDAADHLERGWTTDILRLSVSNGHKLTYKVQEIAPAFDVIQYDWKKERKFKN